MNVIFTETTYRKCSNKKQESRAGAAWICEPTVRDLLSICIYSAPGDFNMHWLLADKFMIEIDRRPRGVASLASHISFSQNINKA